MERAYSEVFYANPHADKQGIGARSLLRTASTSCVRDGELRHDEGGTDKHQPCTLAGDFPSDSLGFVLARAPARLGRGADREGVLYA